MTGLARQLKEIQFGAGMNTKGDRRAQPEQLLDIAVNVEFDDVGGLRVRFPFDNVRTALVGGGTLANARRLAMLGEELICFTSTAVYSWIPALLAWEYRGDHPAIATDEQTVFAAPGDQDYCDRAELNGQIVTCWRTNGQVLIGVRDKASGAVIQPATVLQEFTTTTLSNPRLVALTNAVMVLTTGTTLSATNVVFVSKITLGPFQITNQPNSGNGFVTITGIQSGIGCYDACRVPGQDRMYVVVNQSGAAAGGVAGYTITSCDESWGGAQASLSRALAPGLGPIAVAVDPSAATLVVARTQQSSTGVFGELWNVTPAATPVTLITGGTIGSYGTGTALQQITCAFRLTKTGGLYRCYAFWSLDESPTSVFECRSNWIDTSMTAGVEARFVLALGIGARAFAHDSHVYLVGTFAGLSFSATDPSGTYSELQNTYYLYRDDALLVGKAAWGEGGGFHAQGWLPGAFADASNANALVLMGEIRRIVPVGKNTELASFPKTYAERAPREITFTFDDNRARRCVQFGATLYVLGSLLLQYDGQQLTELGTTSYPWAMTVGAGASGAIAAGGYSYKATDRWMNAKGEVDRSTTATVANFTLGATNSMVVTLPNLYITRKSNVALEVWRTQVNPASGVPFFLVTSQDPSVAAGDNKYLANAPTSIALASLTDNILDAALAQLPANPENNSVLPSIEPPPAAIAFTDNQRIYLAGIPGYPNTVYYSKYRQPGLVAAFNDLLSFDTPADGGAITAIGMLDGVLIVWCQTSTYAFGGVGLDDTGGGSNFTLSRIVSKDLGCVAPEACAYFDDGFLAKTSKGWYVLGRDLNYAYAGDGPAAYDGETVYATSVLTSRHQIRALTSGRMLVFDTLVKSWGESSLNDGLDALLWNGTPAYLTATGMRAELATWAGYAGSDYTLTLADVETSWIKFGEGMQGRVIVDFVQLLGELRSVCAVRKRIAKDYEAVSAGVWNYNTDVTVSPIPGTIPIDSKLQLRQAPAKKRCEAIKARFTFTALDGVSPLPGPCARMTSIVMPYAVEPNAYSAISAAQKA